MSLPKNRCTITNITYHSRKHKNCWLQISLRSSKLALTFRLIHSIVTLGHPDDHFRDGFQMKQAIFWPIYTDTLSMHNISNYDVTAACGYVGYPLNGFKNLLAPLKGKER